MITLQADTDPLTAIMFNLGGGIFRVRLYEPDAVEGRRTGLVLDDKDDVIGTASDYIYGASGFAVHTRPFAGFVPAKQIEFV